MKIEVMREAGYEEALIGLSLSYNTPLDKMPDVALRLARKGGGHAKFLESIAVWLDITAARMWWQQMATYRIGTSTQSESSMHTIMKRRLQQTDFKYSILPSTLRGLNRLIEVGEFSQLKNELPEGFLQRRIVCLNYKVLKHIISQRHDHRLSEWQIFCKKIVDQVECPEYLNG